MEPDVPSDDGNAAASPDPLAPASFGANLRGLSKAAFQETKRHAQLAALKAKIEKIKHIDLTKAHYALGKKAYKVRATPKQFDSRYSELAELEQRIAMGRQGTSAVN